MCASTVGLAKDEKRWRAEGDVRTLKEAEQIMRDRERHNLAKVAASKEVDALKAIAGKPPEAKKPRRAAKPIPKPPGKKK